jgi:hypothetical protein
MMKKFILMQMWIAILCLFIIAATFVSTELLSQDVLTKSTVFSLYEDNDFYDDIEMEEESISTDYYDHGIEFQPSKLMFDNSPICMPSLSQIEIHNSLDYSIDILAITSRDPQFHPVLFQPQAVGADGSVIIQILFLPYYQGISTSELIIETSESTLYYPLVGRAVDNPYHLRPFTNNKVIIGSPTFNIPVHIYNPHSTTLHIMEVFTTEDFLSLSNAQDIHMKSNPSQQKVNNSIDMVWSIAPGSEEIMMTLNVATTVNPGFQRGYVHIKTDHDKLIVPIEVDFVPGGLRLIEPELSFGIMTTNNEQKSLELLIANDGQENVKILDVTIEGSGEGLTVVFDDELMIYANRPYTKVATAIFKSQELKVGQQSGKIKIFTNSTNEAYSILEIPFSVVMLQGGIGYHIDDIVYYINPYHMQQYTNQYVSANGMQSFDPTDTEICVEHIKEVKFANYYPNPISIHSAQLHSCHDVMKIVEEPKVSTLQPLESWGPLKIGYCVEKILYHYINTQNFLPKTCWLEVISNISSHRVPLYVLDGKIDVEMVDSVSHHFNLYVL